MEMIDFSTITNEELEQLEDERDAITPKMIVETKPKNPLLNELRFNYGFWFINHLLINGQTGSSLELRIDEKRGNLHVAFIKVLEPKKGGGSELMELLTSLADKYGYSMDLHTDTRFGTPKRVLNKFYQKFGFKKEKGSNEHFIRPKKATV